ncbi:MAG: tetrahydromethanopterin S-methyltransferase subunit H family protein [Candidatus Ranarchaeia archaeon]
MFDFQTEQKVFEIGEIKVGGIPAQNPTVLIGSIFYHGDKLVLDGQGHFDRQRAEAVLQNLAEMQDKTAMPAMLDVVGSSANVMEQYLEFIVDHTDVPILVDGAGNYKAALAGLRYAKDQGFLGRCVYNSLLPEASDDEKNELRSIGVESAILLTYGDAMQMVTSSGFRVETAKKLVTLAESIGIKNMLIDTVVLDIPTLGLAAKAIYRIKDEMGYPAGCGAHNSVDKWKGLKEKFDKKRLKLPALAVSNVVPVAVGADFLLYGPIQHADIIFPLIGFVNTSYVQILREQGIRIKKDQKHPRWKIG